MSSDGSDAILLKLKEQLINYDEFIALRVHGLEEGRWELCEKIRKILRGGDEEGNAESAASLDEDAMNADSPEEREEENEEDTVAEVSETGPGWAVVRVGGDSPGGGGGGGGVLPGTVGRPPQRHRQQSAAAEKEPRGVVGPLKGKAKKAAKGTASAARKAATTPPLPFARGVGKQTVKESCCGKRGAAAMGGGGAGRKRGAAAMGGGGGSDAGGGTGLAKRLRDDEDDDDDSDAAGFPMTGAGGGKQNRGAATFVVGERSLLVSDAAGTKPAQAWELPPNPSTAREPLQKADSASVAVGTSQDGSLPGQGQQRGGGGAVSLPEAKNFFKELFRFLFGRCKSDPPRLHALKEMMKELQRLRVRGDVTSNRNKELLNRARTIVGEDMLKEALATAKERIGKSKKAAAAGKGLHAEENEIAK